MEQFSYKTADDAPTCLECGDVIQYGRQDKKFCCDSCKNRYHNRRAHHQRYVRLRVLGALDRNYAILEKLIRAGMTSISLGDIALMGYNTEYVTSHHKVGGHNEYRCFDIKYLSSSTRIFNIGKVREI